MEVLAMYAKISHHMPDESESTHSTCLSMVASSSWIPVYRLNRALPGAAGSVCMYGGSVVGCAKHKLCWIVIALPTSRLGHNLNTFCTKTARQFSLDYVALLNA